jgi:starch synthase
LESNRLKILVVSPEVVPFAKTGGLADVTGALPQALARLGHQVKVMLPRYRMVDRTKFRLSAVKPDLPPIQIGKRQVRVGLDSLKATPDGVEHLFLVDDQYYGRDALYTDPATGRHHSLQRLAVRLDTRLPEDPVCRRRLL